MNTMSIIQAILLLGMVVLIWPRAMSMVKNSPKAEQGDWRSAALVLCSVFFFVILLIQMVRS